MIKKFSAFHSKKKKKFQPWKRKIDFSQKIYGLKLFVQEDLIWKF